MGRKARPPRDEERPAVTNAGSAGSPATPGPAAEGTGKTSGRARRQRNAGGAVPKAPVGRTSKKPGEPTLGAPAHWLEHIRRQAPHLVGPDGTLMFETFVSAGVPGRFRVPATGASSPIDSARPPHVPQRRDSVVGRADELGGGPALPKRRVQAAPASRPPGRESTRARVEPSGAPDSPGSRPARKAARRSAEDGPFLSMLASYTPDPRRAPSRSARRRPLSVSPVRATPTPGPESFGLPESDSSRGPALPPAIDDRAGRGLVATRLSVSAVRGAMASPRRPPARPHTFGPERDDRPSIGIRRDDRASISRPSDTGLLTGANPLTVGPQPAGGFERSGPPAGWPSLLEPPPDDEVDWRRAERFLVREARLVREQRAF
jgi:hypothetical protein